jgi:hypothetical protein
MSAMKERLLLLSVFTGLAALLAVFIGQRGEAEPVQPPSAVDRARTLADAVPAELSARAVGQGLDVADSRKLATDVYLVRRGDGGYCSLTGDAIACGPSDFFGQFPALYTLITTKTAIGALVELTGAARRDVASVRVDGVPHLVTPDGGFSISLASRPSLIEFVGQAGGVLYKREVPSP